MSEFARSRVGYYADFASVPALIAAALAAQAAGPGFDLRWLAGAIAGAAVWTLAEYVIHRFVFHRAFRREHWLHHLRPAAYIGVSPWLTLLFAVTAYGAVIGSLGMTFGGGAFVGLMLGYLAYIVTHDALHHRQIPRGHWLRPAFERHALHHRGLEANFGVVCPFWDLVFGTYVPPSPPRKVEP